MIYVYPNYLKGGFFQSFCDRMAVYQGFEPRNYGDLGTRLHKPLNKREQDRWDSPRFRKLAQRVCEQSVWGMKRDCWDAVRMITGMSLKPHNDDLNRRRVSFVYYYHTAWSDGQGGELVFYEREGSVPLILLPAPNTLVLFSVGKDTIHEVLPVKGADSVRKAITGWLAEE